MPGEPFEVAALQSRSLVLGVLCFSSGSPEGLFVVARVVAQPRARFARIRRSSSISIVVRFGTHTPYRLNMYIPLEQRFDTPARPWSRDQVSWWIRP
jgi:hypothetical protein